jgi:hypothetical protein
VKVITVKYTWKIGKLGPRKKLAGIKINEVWREKKQQYCSSGPEKSSIYLTKWFENGINQAAQCAHMYKWN